MTSTSRRERLSPRPLFALFLSSVVLGTGCLIDYPPPGSTIKNRSDTEVRVIIEGASEEFTVPPRDEVVVQEKCLGGDSVIVATVKGEVLAVFDVPMCEDTTIVVLETLRVVLNNPDGDQTPVAD